MKWQHTKLLSKDFSLVLTVPTSLLQISKDVPGSSCGFQYIKLTGKVSGIRHTNPTHNHKPTHNHSHITSNQGHSHGREHSRQTKTINTGEAYRIIESQVTWTLLSACLFWDRIYFHRKGVTSCGGSSFSLEDKRVNSGVNHLYQQALSAISHPPHHSALSQAGSTVPRKNAV